jgi:hypothetical protein
MKLLTMFASLLIGIFLASVAMGIADKGGLPLPITYLIAPGNILMKIFPAAGWRELGRALFANVTLYASLSYIVLRRLTRNVRLPKSQNFWTQP